MEPTEHKTSAIPSALPGVRCGAQAVLVAVLLAAGLAGCASSGDKAAARGDWDLAVEGYRDALGRSPESEELRAKLERACAEAAQMHLRAAREHLELGRASPAIRELRRSLECEQRPETLALLERAIIANTWPVPTAIDKIETEIESELSGLRRAGAINVLLSTGPTGIVLAFRDETGKMIYDLTGLSQGEVDELINVFSLQIDLFDPGQQALLAFSVPDRFRGTPVVMGSLPAPAQQEPELEPRAAPVPGPRITGVMSEGGEQIEILAEGRFHHFHTFLLREPPRIVTDFFGAGSAVWPANLPLDTGPVARIRVGKHPEKARVVLDLRAEVSSHRVQLTETGASILLVLPGRADDGTDSARAPATPP